MLDLRALYKQLTDAGLPVYGVGVDSTQTDKPHNPQTWYPNPEDSTTFVRVDWTTTPTSAQDQQAGSIVAAFTNPPPPPKMLKLVIGLRSG